LREGFRLCNERNLEVTDDVSVVEQVEGLCKAHTALLEGSHHKPNRASLLALGIGCLRELVRRASLALPLTPCPPVLPRQIGKPVKITVGEYTNLKLTTPEDMLVANEILRGRAAQLAAV
jgi:hypothetical protein